jgi:hypothetical protein
MIQITVRAGSGRTPRKERGLPASLAAPMAVEPAAESLAAGQ